MAARAGVLALVLAALAAAAGAGSEPATAEREFAGSWTASGHRETVATGPTCQASSFSLSGAVLLTRGEGLSQGFQGTAIGFDDGEGLSAGRAVWTDEHGDQIWSRISTETLGTGKHVTGIITGGSGRYAGVQGDYSFTWQYVVSPIPGEVQGRSSGLTGHVRGPQVAH